MNEPILRGIREGRWKLFLESPEVDIDGPALYDLYADVGEVNNVSDKHSDVVERLAKLARENDRAMMSQVRPLGRVAE